MGYGRGKRWARKPAYGGASCYKAKKKSYSAGKKAAYNKIRFPNGYRKELVAKEPRSGDWEPMYQKNPKYWGTFGDAASGPGGMRPRGESVSVSNNVGTEVDMTTPFMKAFGGHQPSKNRRKLTTNMHQRTLKNLDLRELFGGHQPEPMEKSKSYWEKLKSMTPDYQVPMKMISRFAQSDTGQAIKNELISSGQQLVVGTMKELLNTGRFNMDVNTSLIPNYPNVQVENFPRFAPKSKYIEDDERKRQLIEWRPKGGYNCY